MREEVVTSLSGVIGPEG
ncbi:hypothetical protein, partial [Mycolicibacterium mucogenicum]